MVVTIQSTGSARNGVPPQRKTYFCNGWWWHLYSDGADLKYEATQNPADWSGPVNTLRIGVINSDDFSCRFYQYLGVWYCYVAYIVDAQRNRVKFRREQATNWGTLIGGSEIGLVVDSSDVLHVHPDVDVGTDDALYVGYFRKITTGFQDIRWRIHRNPNNDGGGLWTLSYSSPLVLWSLLFTGWGSVLRLTDTKMYTIYCFEVVNNFYGVEWTGAVWLARETIVSGFQPSMFGAGKKGDDVYFGYYDPVVIELRFKLRDYDAVPQWQPIETIVVLTAGGTYPHLCVDDSTGDCWAFWVNRQGLNESIKYNMRTGGAWGVVTTLVTGELYPQVISINCFWEPVNQKIGVSWSRNEIAPYDLRFHVLDLAVVVLPLAGLHPSKMLPLLLDG